MVIDIEIVGTFEGEVCDREGDPVHEETLEGLESCSWSRRSTLVSPSSRGLKRSRLRSRSLIGACFQGEGRRRAEDGCICFEVRLMHV